MLVVLSPSKSVTEREVPFAVTQTPVLFDQRTKELVTSLQKLPQKQLQKALQVSEPLAMLNHDRFQQWANTTTKPAFWLYAGDVYNGLDAFSMSADDAAWAQDHTLIVSGLYGLLRPMDGIRPHRLEMRLPYSGGWGKDLYAAWKDDITAYLEAQKPATIVLCASQEYAKAITVNAPAETMLITPKFKQDTPAGLKEKPLFSKYARGALARYIINTRAERPEQLKSFDKDGFAFAPDLSTGTEYVYIIPRDFTLKGRFTKS